MRLWDQCVRSAIRGRGRRGADARGSNLLPQPFGGAGNPRYEIGVQLRVRSRGGSELIRSHPGSNLISRERICFRRGSGLTHSRCGSSIGVLDRSESGERLRSTGQHQGRSQENHGARSRRRRQSDARARTVFPRTNPKLGKPSRS